MRLIGNVEQLYLLHIYHLFHDNAVLHMHPHKYRIYRLNINEYIEQIDFVDICIYHWIFEHLIHHNSIQHHHNWQEYQTLEKSKLYIKKKNHIRENIYHNAMPHFAPVVLPFDHVHEFVEGISE